MVCEQVEPRRRCHPSGTESRRAPGALECLGVNGPGPVDCGCLSGGVHTGMRGARVAGLVLAAGLVAGGCGDDGGEAVRSVSVCVPVTGDRPAGTQGRVEIRQAATVLAGGSVAAGGSFETTVPVDVAADVYLDGVLLDSSPAGTDVVSLNCPVD